MRRCCVLFLRIKFKVCLSIHAYLTIEISNKFVIFNKINFDFIHRHLSSFIITRHAYCIKFINFKRAGGKRGRGAGDSWESLLHLLRNLRPHFLSRVVQTALAFYFNLLVERWLELNLPYLTYDFSRYLPVCMRHDDNNLI